MFSENSVTTESILPVLKDVTIFSGIAEHEIVSIYERCPILEARVGEIIIEENTPATEILIILKGRVSIVLNLKEDPMELIEFGQGCCIGEASVIGIQDHSASAVVMDDALLMIFSRKVLMEIFENDKNLFSLLILNIAREIARRLHRTDEILLHYGKNRRD